MRRILTTNVNVQVIDRTDRTNVVATLGNRLRRMRLFARGTGEALARCLAETLCLAQALCLGKAPKRWQAKYAACHTSPSWGGHRSSGRSGSARRR